MLEILKTKKRGKNFLSFRPMKDQRPKLVNNFGDITKFYFICILRADFDGLINGYLDSKEGT